MGLGAVALEAKRVAAGRFRFDRASQGQQCACPVDMVDRHRWNLSDRLLDGRQCRGGMTGLQRENPEHVQRIGVLGRSREDLAIAGLGLGQASGRMQLVNLPVGGVDLMLALAHGFGCSLRPAATSNGDDTEGTGHMHPRLLSWGRRVHRRTGLPALWLFTDELRLPDPRAAVFRLPRGVAGVVLRHDATPERLRLGRELARICRARRLALVVAGDTRLAAALGAGVHLRAGRWPSVVRIQRQPAGWGGRRLLTSSAHNGVELRRARRAGIDLGFLSPAFPTVSHPGARGLGVTRWTAVARRCGSLPVAALGGVDGESVRRLPLRLCAGMGGIGALT